MNFVQLHIHTYYSILDGINSPEEYVKKAKDLGMKAIAITDHGSMSGVLRFSNACREMKIKGIIGCEFYINDKRGTSEGKAKGTNRHIVLLAKNKTGYKNLLKINYDSFYNGFYYRGRTTTNFIFKHSKGLICLTACMGGPIAQCLLEGNNAKTEKIFLRWKEVFKDDFYGELHFNELKDQVKVTRGILKLCRKYKVKYVVTGDCHYINKEDAELQDYLLMINQKKRVSDDNVFRFTTRNLYFHTPKFYFKMNKKYKYNLTNSEIEKSIATTQDIAKKCNYSLSEEESKFPAFIDRDGNEVQSDILLLSKCVKGLSKVFVEEYPPDEYRERMKKELLVIRDKGYSDYFLIVQDIINFCKRNKIAVGPGRGSAAGSLVSYLLGITKVDPIRFNLLFERFLNKERNDAPDIDLDFEADRKVEIESYLKRKYGGDRVAHIITFSTFRIRGALRDMARVLNKEKDKDFITIISKIEDTPMEAIYYLKDQIKDGDWSVSERSYIKRNELMFEMADRLIGRIRQFGQHAGGTAITPGPIYNYIPVSKVKGDIVTAFREGTVSRELTQLGILKIDILGLENVSTIKHTIDMVEDDLGEVIDINNVDLYINDKKLYKILREEDCVGIFQFEPRGINNFLKVVGPEDFEDVAAINALYRPAIAKANEHMKYANRRKKLKQLGKKFSEHYKAPIFGEILNNTYGTIAYQEQFIEILHKLGGVSLEEADIARKIFKDLYLKALSAETKKSDPRLLKLVDNFRAGAKKRANMSDSDIDKLVNKLVYFSEYSFNRSHSVSYAIIAMQTLYLREYYSIYYYTALLNTAENKEISHDFKQENKMKTYMHFIRKRMGNDIFKRIDVQKSIDKFYIEDGKIRVPLSVVHGVGSSLPNEIRRISPFTSFSDFCLKELKIKSNKTAILNLINIGAFDSLIPTNGNRRGLNLFWEEWMKRKARFKDKPRSKIKTYISKIWANVGKCKDYLVEEKRKLEKEICKFNMFCSDPPKVLKKIKYARKEGKIVLVNEQPSSGQYYCVKITSTKMKLDKNGNKMMFLVGEDWEEQEVEIIVFYTFYKKFKKILDGMTPVSDDYYIVQGYSDAKGKIIVGAKSRNEIIDHPIRKLDNLLNRIKL